MNLLVFFWETERGEKNLCRRQSYCHICSPFSYVIPRYRRISFLTLHFFYQISHLMSDFPTLTRPKKNQTIAQAFFARAGIFQAPLKKGSLLWCEEGVSVRAPQVTYRHFGTTTFSNINTLSLSDAQEMRCPIRAKAIQFDNRRPENVLWISAGPASSLSRHSFPWIPHSYWYEKRFVDGLKYL